MLDLVKFWTWLRASDLKIILDESKLWAQSLKVKAKAFWAFKQLVYLWCFGYTFYKVIIDNLAGCEWLSELIMRPCKLLAPYGGH